jgi:hypothetical protein
MPEIERTKAKASIGEALTNDLKQADKRKEIVRSRLAKHSF